jgi:hypothetical protein
VRPRRPGEGVGREERDQQEAGEGGEAPAHNEY